MARKRSDSPGLTPTRPADTSLLEEMIAEPATVTRIDGVVVGRVRAIFEDGHVAFDAPDLAPCPPARSLVDPATLAVGAEIALIFEAGDPGRGVVLGPLFASAERRAVLDDRELVLEAKREIVLRCGEASIRLTRDGRIVLRGKHLLSRARVTNRVKGGTVQIN